MKVGDYVQVVQRPDPWEGGGEDTIDREAYIGHVGVVLETDFHEAWEPSRGMVLVRFPETTDYAGFGQRNVEYESLKLVSSPPVLLPRVCIESSPALRAGKVISDIYKWQTGGSNGKM